MRETVRVELLEEGPSTMYNRERGYEHVTLPWAKMRMCFSL